MLLGYSNTSFTWHKIDGESTFNTCQLPTCMLIWWFSKKQNSIALSTIEAEYTALESCYAQFILMKEQLTLANEI